MRTRVPIAFFLLLTWCLASEAEVRLPKVLSNGAVLQHGQPVNLWGWADDGENIEISLDGRKIATAEGRNGQWSVRLPAQDAGGPHTIGITGTNRLLLRDVYFGDVWIASGQSNMQMLMESVKGRYPEEFDRPRFALIRQFTVPKSENFESPQVDFERGSWIKADSTEQLDQFSAVAFFFAKHIHETHDVPIGIINSSFSGSRIEGWMSEAALSAFPEQLAVANQYRVPGYVSELKALDRRYSDYWTRALNAADSGLNESIRWFDPKLDDQAWESVQMPGLWRDGQLGDFSGVVWLRKAIYVAEPDSKDNPVLLELGRLVDADTVFVNGVEVGNTGSQWPQRRYSVPAELLQEGSNSITVRLVVHQGNGGFVPDKHYRLKLGEEVVDLAGTWKFRKGARAVPKLPPRYRVGQPLGHYNAMIAPLLSYAIKGAIWYQGEGNTGSAEDYEVLFPTMISDWRKAFNQGNFPFVFVQLPSYSAARPQPTESNWAALRFAQFRTLSVPNTAMAITIDTGAWNDLHPDDKRPVGERLALAARKLAYGEQALVASGPLFSSMTREGNTLEIEFTETGSGLIVEGERLNRFEIARDRGPFIKADAIIRDNKVIVWHDTIRNPVRVRYAWATNPDGANLYNQEGLPASPFEARVD